MVEVHMILDDHSDAFASGVAVAKGLPLYSRKTTHIQPMEPQHYSKVIVSFALASRPDIRVSDLIDLDAIEAAGDGTRLAAYLVDAPCNEMHTDLFVNQCRLLAKALGGEENHVFLRVLRGEDLREAGLNLLFNVGKAAEHPSNMAILTYAPPEASSSKCITLVGKGIVFDTGGTCMKTSENMRGMKRDMGGAAAVLGAFQSIVRKRYIRHVVHAVLCLAENQISEKAMRIDDIHVGFSGKTVEINNTDAEGRLVVADGVAYASRMLNSAVIIDVATLTGSQAVATGRRIAAIYSNSEQLEDLAVQAGRVSGDLCHPLPYVPEFWRSHLESDIADMKNAVSKRDNCPSACAAHFIEEHLPGDYSGAWMHIDMAGPVSLGDRASGFGVGLLSQLFYQVDCGMDFAEGMNTTPTPNTNNNNNVVVVEQQPHQSMNHVAMGREPQPWEHNRGVNTTGAPGAPAHVNGVTMVNGMPVVPPLNIPSPNPAVSVSGMNGPTSPVLAANASNGVGPAVGTSGNPIVATSNPASGSTNPTSRHAALAGTNGNSNANNTANGSIAVTVSSSGSGSNTPVNHGAAGSKPNGNAPNGNNSNNNNNAANGNHANLNSRPNNGGLPTGGPASKQKTAMGDSMLNTLNFHPSRGKRDRVAMNASPDMHQPWSKRSAVVGNAIPAVSHSGDVRRISPK